jgi:hypothetical protein
MSYVEFLKSTPSLLATHSSIRTGALVCLRVEHFHGLANCISVSLKQRSAGSKTMRNNPADDTVFASDVYTDIIVQYICQQPTKEICIL